MKTLLSLHLQMSQHTMLLVTHKLSIFSMKIVRHSSRWTWHRGHIIHEIHWALSLPPYLDNSNCTNGIKLGAQTDPLGLMHVPPTVQSMCWFVSHLKWVPANVLNSVCAAHRTVGTEQVKLWYHNDLIYAWYYRWCSFQQIWLFQAWNQMVSGSQATVHV